MWPNQGTPDFSTDKTPRSVLARSDHGSHKFMSWNEKLWLGKVSVADMKVRPADAAGHHLDDELARRRCRVLPLHETERPRHLFSTIALSSPRSARAIAVIVSAPTLA